MLLGYGYLGFFFLGGVGLRMPRMLGGQVNFFWGQNQIGHQFTQITITPPFTQITITPPVITQSNNNREGMVPRIWKEPIQNEKVRAVWILVFLSLIILFLSLITQKWWNLGRERLFGFVFKFCFHYSILWFFSNELAKLKTSFWCFWVMEIELCWHFCKYTCRDTFNNPSPKCMRYWPSESSTINLLRMG